MPKSHFEAWRVEIAAEIESLEATRGDLVRKRDDAEAERGRLHSLQLEFNGALGGRGVTSHHVFDRIVARVGEPLKQAGAAVAKHRRAVRELDEQIAQRRLALVELARALRPSEVDLEPEPAAGPVNSLKKSNFSPVVMPPGAAASA